MNCKKNSRAGRLLLFWLFLLSASVSSAQSQSVRGRVTDEKGSGLSGVTITVKGKSASTVSDASGNYEITIPDGASVLVVSYVGYLPQEMAVTNRSTINLTLQQQTTSLGEVVVVGYGTKSRESVTGSISKTDSKIFESRPLTNTLNAMQGALPGVTVVRGSGAPGREDYNIQVRGYASINGNRPLVLIDGVPSDLNTINPNDIESITVLKDAAASIYGARAADGVVLVTTKSGKQGRPIISYSSNVGYKQPQFLKKMANTLQLAEMYDQGLRNIGQPGLSQTVFDKIRNNAQPEEGGGWMKYLEQYPGLYQTTDWTKEVYKNSMLQMHNVSISGGGDNNKYLFSAGYNNNQGIFTTGKNESDRYNLRLNYDFNFGKRFNLETRTSFENQVTTEPSEAGEALRVFARAWSYIPIRNPQGRYYGYQNYGNPLQALEEGGQRKINNSRLSTNFKADLTIAKNLVLTGQAGITNEFYNDQANYKTYKRWKWDGTVENTRNTPNSAYQTNNRNLYKIFSAYLNYKKTFGAQHNLSLMAGTSHEDNNAEGQTTWGYDFRSNDIFTLNLANRTRSEYANFTGFLTDWALNSYFSRLSYSFSNKVFIDFSTRLDGSSKFSPDKRWSAIFPAVLGSWVLTNEKFIKDLNVLNSLKLRASWGQSGNQELSFGNYDYIPLITISGTYPLGSPNAGTPGAVQSIASESRTWETIETKNIGLDFGLLNSHLNSTFDYFIRNNNNMLVGVQVPAVLGGTPPSQNLGKLQTKGWEFSLSWRDKVKDFKYGISAMISDSKNKLAELKGNNGYVPGLNSTREGYPINSYFGYDYSGIIKTQGQLDDYKKLQGIPANLGIGDVMYRDVDGDGKITAFGDPSKGYSGDLVYLGNLLPRYTYSSTFDLSWKNFDLSALFQGVGKRQGIKYGDFGQPFQFVWHQPLEYFYGKTWSPENPDAKYPRIIPGGIGFDALQEWDWRTSSMRVDNMAYLRVKFLTLGYNLPAGVTSRLKTQSIRVYVSGQDLFTFSKGTWNGSFDPEEIWQRNDEQTYPFSKVYSFGLDVRF